MSASAAFADPPVPEIDIAEAERFLTLLAEGERVTFQTFDDLDTRKTPSLARVLHGDLDQHGDALVALNKADAGIFVTVNRTDGGGRKEENITGIRAGFLDLDGAPLEPVLAAGVDPHIVTESSPGRWHVYWLVSDCSVAQFKPIQQALARKFNGDPAVCDPPRVMRLPGFLHRKGEPFLTRIHAASNEQPYSTADLVERLGLDLSKHEQRAGDHRDHTGGQDDWIVAMLTGADLHQNALRVIGSMVGKGFDQKTITGVFNGMRPALEKARGDARVAALFGAELDRMITGAFRKFAAPEPMPLSRDPVPASAYPLAAITRACPLIGDAISDIATAAQASEEIAGASVLTAAALIAQSHFDVGVDDRHYPLSLFCLTTAFSGERKSECDNLALAAVAEHERRAQAAYRLAKQQDEKTEIPNPRMLDSDPTLEGIAKSFEKGCPTRLISCADGGLFVGGYGMGAENRLKTSAGLTLLFDGKPITRTRAAEKESVTYYGRRVSLHLQGQPAAIGSFVNDPVLRNQGLLARCLLAVPAVRTGRVYETTRASTLSGLAAFRRWQSGMLDRRLPLRIYNEEETDELDPAVIPLDDSAIALFAAAYNQCQRAIEPGGPMESCREFGSRMPEHAARIAGIFAVANGHDQVGETDLQGALAVVRWHASEWLRSADAVAQDEDLRQAGELLAWLQRPENANVTSVREVYRVGPRFIRSASVARRVLSALADAGHLIWHDGRRDFHLNRG